MSLITSVLLIKAGSDGHLILGNRIEITAISHVAYRCSFRIAIAGEHVGDWNSAEAVFRAAEHATRLRYQYLEERQDFVFEKVFSAAEKLEFLQKAKKAEFSPIKHR